MKKILLSTLLIFNILTALNSQIVVGTPSGISGAIFRNNLLKAFKSVTEMGFLRAEMKKELEKSRIEYWSKYPNISEDSPIALNYYYWLTQKDFYTLGIAISNYIENSVDKSRWDNNSLGFRGTADLLAAFVGGKQEDMIEPYAKDTYKNWEESVISYWRENGFGIFDGKTLLDSYEKNANLYESHFLKVLQAEYLFHSPKSPLLSNDAHTFVKCILFLSNFKSDSESNAFIEGLTQYVSSDEINKGIEEWKHYYGRDELWLNKLRKEAGYPSNSRRLEWFIVKNSKPYVYALYSIKRRFLLDWDMAENILQNRIKRYGKNEVDIAIQKIWENRDNSKYRCIGDPYNNRNEKRLNEIGLNWYSIKSNEDCLCEELDGNTVLWNDLYDMMTSHSLDDLKRGFIKRNNISNEQYAKIVSVLSPEILLYAEYLQAEYGDILYMADEIGVINYELLKTVSDTDRPSTASSIIRIMDGLAEIKNHKESHLVIACWKKNLSEMSWEVSKKANLIEALETAVDSTLSLYEKFGKENVLRIFPSSKQYPPDPFTNIFSLKSRWDGQYDWILSRLTPKVQLLTTEVAFRKSLQEKYNKLFEQYNPNTYKSKIISETVVKYGNPVVNYSNGTIYESDEVKLDLYWSRSGDKEVYVNIYLNVDENYNVCNNIEFSSMLTYLIKPVLSQWQLGKQVIWGSISVEGYLIHEGRFNANDKEGGLFFVLSSKGCEYGTLKKYKEVFGY